MKPTIIILSLLFYFNSPYSNAQSIFNPKTIPDSLKNNANAVYILDEGMVEIKSPGTYTFKNHQVITILNREGLFHLTQSFGINKFHSLENVQVKVYDSLGTEIKKYKKKDFTVQAYNDETTFLSDYKILYLQAFAPTIPCTIEIESEEHITSFIDLPDWTVSPPGQSVLKTIFTVKTPEGLDIRYNIENIKLPPPVINREGKYKIYKWEAANIKAEKYELNGYEINNYLPKIQLAPQLFEYDGYQGSFANWQSFGTWAYNLYEEANPFTEKRVTEILSLIKNDNTEAEKIKTLYNYLKNNTRYVSIQLGIGGFKPFPVSFVDNKKYGDCKALTNYMRYMLKVAGINAYPALINAGHNKLPANINFPTSIFNHVILCIPLKKDTVWLECTSTNNECGILGSFTENKRALLLTEKGGILINTPPSNYYNNLLHSRSVVNLDEKGGANASSHFFYKGEFTGMFEQVRQQSNDKQKIWLSRDLYFKEPDALQVTDFSAEKSILTINASYEQLFGFKTGTKYFLQSKIFKFSENFIQQNEDRKLPYVFDYPYKKTDTTVYHLGKYFTLESIPAKKIFKNEYAAYEQDITFNADDNSITTITTFILKQHIVPAKNYKELAAFFNEMNQAEHTKIVIKKL